MTHARDSISALCQALNARILQSILQTGLLPGEEIAPAKKNSLEIIRVLLHNYMFDRALTTMAKAVDKITSSSPEVENCAKCDEDLWELWTTLKDSVQIYTEMQEMTRKNVTYDMKHCGGPSCPQSENIIRLRRCSGCAVARYCLKQCQRSDWKTRHRLVCKPLRLSVGPSHPKHIVRSLALLAGSEVGYWGNKITEQILAHTRKTRPDCNYLVMEFDMTALPVTVSVWPMSEYLQAFGNDSLWKELGEELKRYQGPREVRLLKLKLGNAAHILLSPHTALASCAIPAGAPREFYGSY
ncbi:hypothetical protein BJ138DRAFT_1154313 [Hygrophoropsis aurantiaca]|uniref:Uncharacterized protein n=1 Tax=Hygrophoropsis aurantiaca TaxID=72124 RepID=A0ACB8A9A2_9AGAM|nr:hypothetical protein BJ138DRAFT_1154313 [Hygrophoropsis aurantiaca]